MLIPNGTSPNDTEVNPNDPNSNQTQNNSSGKYFILKIINTEMKPTCLIQISQRHIAVATGFLNDKSAIEVINIFTGNQTSILQHHDDMIDSMRLVNLNKYNVNKI